MPIVTDSMLRQTTEYPDSYKREVFMIWYKLDKPSAHTLYDKIPENEYYNSKPQVSTLKYWVTKYFRGWAEEMDQVVLAELQARTVKEKIDMLERHTEVGKRMQNLALDYLEEHQEELSPNSAVRMLVEGIRVERESRGIPQALAKMVVMSDDQLMSEVQQLLSRSPIELSQPMESKDAGNLLELDFNDEK